MLFCLVRVIKPVTVYTSFRPKDDDDNLIYALLIKYLSDRQINIDKKLIEYIIKRIDRSYEKIFLFIVEFSGG